MHIFSVILASVLGLCACGESDDSPIDDGGSTKVPEVSVSSAGGSQVVSVTTTEAWRAFPSNNENWITISPESGKAGKVDLTVTVKENKEYKARNGQITVKAGTKRQYIEVKQEAAVEPEPEPEPEIVETEPVNLDCPLEGYNLVWHDEFQADALNTTDWTYEQKPAGWVNNELQTYVKGKSPMGEKVAEVKNGLLRINCFKEGDKVYSARLYGKVTQGWQYGYVEASIRLPKGKGTWPAFWMMPVHFTSWPHDGEIDIMEEVGYHPNYVSSSLHADGHVHSNNTQVTKEVYCKGAEGEFHKYGMEWTADYFQFYVDGKPTLYYKNPGTGVRDWPYDAPFYVILNLAWGGSWGGSQGVNPSALPVSMYVDYVRVWQK